jgi:hypothetical protein
MYCEAFKVHGLQSYAFKSTRDMCSLFVILRTYSICRVQAPLPSQAKRFYRESHVKRILVFWVLRETREKHRVCSVLIRCNRTPFMMLFY